MTAKRIMIPWAHGVCLSAVAAANGWPAPEIGMKSKDGIMRKSKHVRNWRRVVLLFMMAVLVFGTPVLMTSAKEVQAVTKSTKKNGLVKAAKNKYYYYKNGVKQKNKWIKIGKYYYYFKKDGLKAFNEFVTVNGKTYYTQRQGRRVYGFQTINKKKYYFKKNTGVMAKGFVWIDGKRYYFVRSNGQMKVNSVFLYKSLKKTYWADKNGVLQTGWGTDAKGNRYYFTPTGAKRNGWFDISGRRYHMGEYGAADVGLKTISGKLYFFRQTGNYIGSMVKNGDRTVDGKKYHFDKNGVGSLVEPENTVNNNTSLNEIGSDRTIKNFLLNSLQPVGSTLYVWGGGHNDADAMRKGVSSVWKTYYNSQSGSYNYNNSRFEVTKGLDCSGFVGWSIYQIMEKKSGGNYYTTLAEDVANVNAQRGFGTVYNQQKLSSSGYKFVAGDLACTSGHTWIVLGQCTDKSVVLVHATPPCLQIAGTPTPNGDYSSQAIALAQQYMNKYYGETVKKFGLKCSTGTYYIKGCNVMRWNNTTLKDPDGYREKTADQILADLFKD